MKLQETGPKFSANLPAVLFLKSVPLLNVSQKSAIRAHFKAKSVDPLTYTPSHLNTLSNWSSLISNTAEFLYFKLFRNLTSPTPLCCAGFVFCLNKEALDTAGQRRIAWRLVNIKAAKETTSAWFGIQLMSFVIILRVTIHIYYYYLSLAMCVSPIFPEF